MGYFEDPPVPAGRREQPDHKRDPGRPPTHRERACAALSMPMRREHGRLGRARSSSPVCRNQARRRAGGSWMDASPPRPAAARRSGDPRERHRPVPAASRERGRPRASRRTSGDARATGGPFWRTRGAGAAMCVRWRPPDQSAPEARLPLVDSTSFACFEFQISSHSNPGPQVGAELFLSPSL